jgi:predicted ATPase/DNA-binding SARP family transcriptional activator
VLRLFGTVTYVNKPVTLERALYLVALLACQKNWMTREEVMLLLWSDDGDEGMLKQRLRQLLYRTKQIPYGTMLETNATQLRYFGQSDVQIFRQAIQERDWKTAVDAYQGEFLQGAVFENRELEEWFLLERSALSSQFTQAALQLASTLPVEAAQVLEKAMVHEPLNETLLKALLEYAKDNPEVGVRAFERFEHQLAQTLQLTPDQELIVLAQSLVIPASPRVSTVKRFKLPVVHGIFVGRQAELDQIAMRFADPLCRLLSLVGVGGIGKTRLSLELAERHQLSDGVVFIDLARLNNAELVPNAILEGLGEQPSELPVERLKQTLAEKAMLLILDNFEHVMTARTVVAELLEHCQFIRIIVTSRESLGLRSEQVFELSGLPAPDSVFALESQDAGQLFLRAAQRSYLDFTLQNQDLAVFNRIYKAVGGIPLGLELAASWIRTLSLPEIADELEQSLDVLAVDAPDMPARHRSFAAVFNSSWTLLTSQEQDVLAKLSVFQGGFDKDMAISLAGTNLPLLLRLVNKSLINRREQRFVIHEMIRQYSQTHLNTKNQQEALSGLAIVALELSAKCFIHAKNEQQTEWSRRIEQEHDNIRSALTWSKSNNFKIGAQISGNLEHFWYIRGYHREGMDWAKQFLNLYHESDLIRLRLIWTQTSLAKELSEYQLARDGAQEYQQLALQLNDTQALAKIEKFYGLLEREQGNLDSGKAHVERAYTMFTALDDVNEIAICFNDLGIIYAMQDNLEMAKEHFTESLRLKRQINDKQGIAYAIGNLGVIAGQLGDFALEKVMQEESLRLKRELGDQQGIANGLHELGKNACDQNQLQLSLDYYSEALEIYTHLGRRFSIINSIHSFAEIAHKLSQIEQALIFETAGIHLSYQNQITPSEKRLRHQAQWREESGLTPAELAKLEFDVEKMSLHEVVNSILTWRNQLQYTHLESETDLATIIRN